MRFLTTTRRRLTWGILAGFLLCCSPVRASDAPVAEDLQVRILLKVLTYDRTITRKPPQMLRLAVVYPPDVEADRCNGEEILRTLDRNRDKTISGIPFDVTPVAFRSREQLLERLEELSINVVYVATGNENNLQAIQEVTAAVGALSLTGAPGYVERGISVGLELNENRPQLVVNLDSLEAEGHELRSSVLKLCKIVGGGP